MSSNRVNRYKNAISVKVPNRRVTVIKQPDGTYAMEWRTALPKNTAPTSIHSCRLGVHQSVVRLSVEGVNALIHALKEAREL